MQLCYIVSDVTLCNQLLISLSYLLRIHAFSISATTVEEVCARMNTEIAEIGIFNGLGSSVQAKDLVNMNVDYIGAGYSLSIDEELGKTNNSAIAPSNHILIVHFLSCRAYSRSGNQDGNLS